MSEDALSGKACICIPRRLFVALVAALWCFWYVGDIFGFMIWYPMAPSTPPKACTSHKCLEIFTCKGMQDATYHVRAPFLLLGGLIFGGFGLHGAVGINHRHLKYFAYFLLAVTAMYSLNLLFDGIFLSYCDHYPSNVIHEVILSTPLSDIPNTPVLEEKKEILKDLESYPRRHVNWLVEQNVWRWYFLLSVFYAVVAFYCSHVTMILSRIYIDGPVGLGVNYRLGAWRAEVLLKHRIEEMEEEIISAPFKEDLKNSSKNEKVENKQVEHLAAEGRQSYGAV